MMKIAIIDGTGREKPEKLKPLQGTTKSDTPGVKGSEIFSGMIDDLEVFYVSGQGKDGLEKDMALDYASVLQTLKDQGCEAVLSASACSSLREEICPGECIIPDRIMDVKDGSGNPSQEHQTDLFSEELRDHLTEAAIIQGITVHNKGTVVMLEAGKVLTRTESEQILAMKGDVIDHSSTAEMLAADEMDLPYARVLLCTGYDSPELNACLGTEKELQDKVDAGYRKIMQILSYAIKKVQQEELTD